MDIIDKLLRTSCYIMDFLPKQVPMNCGGQFFEVETYLLRLPIPKMGFAP